MGNKSKKASGGPAEQMRPTISIYQNPDHVAGILQQLHVAPLITGESREHGGSASEGNTRGTTAGAGANAGARVPFLGALGLNAETERVWANESGLTNSNRTVQNFTYSQAYYLYVVRAALQERNLLRLVASAEDAKDLGSGDFVEFQATFRPNELHALLDILTPDLIAAITNYQVKNVGIKAFPNYETIDELKVFSETLHANAANKSDLARAIAEATRVDFRAEKTREFYGDIGHGEVTAVTICDNPHFVVDDEDRILDGTFTVLGKVTSAVETDLPILARNKVLDRLDPDVVDELFTFLRTSVGEQAAKIEATGDDGPDMSNMLDVALQSRINGSSFKVVPIAVYA